MKKIILLRHGQSTWNQENRFTGWTDVPLSKQGQQEARQAGQMLKEQGLVFNRAFTSYLSRAIQTLNLVLQEINQDWIDVHKSWRLNEKHYGILQGLNKTETAEKYGKELVKQWRRGMTRPLLPWSRTTTETLFLTFVTKTYRWPICRVPNRSKIRWSAFCLIGRSVFFRCWNGSKIYW